MLNFVSEPPALSRTRIKTTPPSFNTFDYYQGLEPHQEQTRRDNFESTRLHGKDTLDALAKRFDETKRSFCNEYETISRTQIPFATSHLHS